MGFGEVRNGIYLGTASVVVNADGSVTITPATGQGLSIAPGGSDIWTMDSVGLVRLPGVWGPTAGFQVGPDSDYMFMYRNSSHDGVLQMGGAARNLVLDPSANSDLVFHNTSAWNLSLIIGDFVVLQGPTTVTFPTANKDYISKVGLGTTVGTARGQFVHVKAGTGATLGVYQVAAVVDADNIQVDRDIHAAGSDIVDGTITVYQDVLNINPPGSSRGHAIRQYGGAVNTGFPLVIGGASSPASGHALGLPDTLFAGKTEFDGDAYFDALVYIPEGTAFGIQWGTGANYTFLYQDTAQDWTISSAAGNVRVITGAAKGLIRRLDATTGGYTSRASEATATLSGASTTIQVNVPAGTRILGCQLRVDTAITSGDGAVSWSAAYSGGSAQAIASGQSFNKNTKANAQYDANAASAVVASEADIAITPNAGTFSGGVVRAVVYYETFTAMANAA